MNKTGDLSRDATWQNGASNKSRSTRAKQDYYATHPRAIDDLFRKEAFQQRVWECACGEGHLSRRMLYHGKDVFSTDLINRGYGDRFFDFLHENPYSETGMDIITNPPYKHAQRFVEKALTIQNRGCKTAMYLKIQFLESKSRVSLFKKYPPKNVYVYSERQTCSKNGTQKGFQKGSAVCYAWFVWEKGYKGEPRLGWIFPEEDDENKNRVLREFYNA